MPIEEELRKDATEIQSAINVLIRDYNAKSAQTSRSKIAENKENTTGFLKHFYEALRGAEYAVYQQFLASTPALNTHISTTTCSSLTHEFNEIKNSANDLPHPRILAELQRDYERRVRHHTPRGDNHEEDDDDAENNRYLPYKVYRYIREKSEYCIRFQAKIGARIVSLFFVTFPESSISVCSKNGALSASSLLSSSSSYLCAAEVAIYQLYAYKVFIWISMVTQLANKECSEKLDVYFYMTPFKKERPRHADEVLSAVHVNTGLTRNCETHGEIIIYRAEEWFKVFVHESMHNFNMDFIDLDLRDANNRLRQTFCIPHGDILLFETYTEAWARIINVMFDAYFTNESALSTRPMTGGGETRSHFIRNVREKLTKNAFFHVNQIVKVLDIMHLKYSEITSVNTEVCRKRYKEDTNVYAYYILGGILSAYALPFICWCCDNNQVRSRGGINAIRFSRSNDNLQHFVDLLSRMARDSVLLNMISFIEMSSASSYSMRKTMRMTPD
jgi:hypothetical protein